VIAPKPKTSGPGAGKKLAEKKPSLLRRLSQRVRRESQAGKDRRPSAASAGSSDEDDETMAFFAQLEANRARREQEAAANRAKLAEEARIAKAKTDAALAQELAEIARRKREEEEREEKRRNSVVAESQARMAELTFSFAWG
jgi:hypothetical protein